MAGKVINSFSWISTADRKYKTRNKSTSLSSLVYINSCFSPTLVQQIVVELRVQQAEPGGSAVTGVAGTINVVGSH